MTSAATSVWQVALGDDFDRLAPELQPYFSRPPEGLVGYGAGVYEVAGSRHRWLRPVLAWLGWRHVLFPEFGRGIPFDVTNTTAPDGSLSAVRTFAFPGVTRVMEDTMRVVDGHVHDSLGRRRGLEARLHPVVDDGMLRLTSSALWLHLGPLRLPLPRVATITLHERWMGDHQRVDVELTSPVLGTWFEYRGDFTYDFR